MLHSLRKRIERDEDGFTLIELMVVVLIIAILLAIAIPTFLGARERAQNRAAQSDIRNVLTAEKTFYADDEVYTQTVADITAIEPSIDVVQGAGTAAAVGIAVAVDDASVAAKGVCVGKISESGDAFSVLDLSTGANAGTYYYSGSSDCNGGEDGTSLTAAGAPGGW